MSLIAKEIVYAARTLMKRPGFSLVAILTLALGIGANTAIFSLVNTVLLRSMPVEQPGEVVAMNMRRKDDSMSAMSRRTTRAGPTCWSRPASARGPTNASTAGTRMRSTRTARSARTARPANRRR